MRNTRSAKVSADLAEMVAAIVRAHKGLSVADVVDPILRPVIVRRFLALPETDRRYAEERIARITTIAATA